MSEKLTPKVGDRVRLVHESGDEATFTVTRFNISYSDGDWYLVEGSSDTTFFKLDGWKVAEVVERVKPPAGTLIKGVDVDGSEFKAFVCRDGEINGMARDVDEWVQANYSWRFIASWEVVS